ncbi:ParB N-terminal domain-containing protein [Microbulbifer epialgicus]
MEDSFASTAHATEGLKEEMPQEKLPAQKIMSGDKLRETTKKRTMVLELNPGICRRWRYYDRFDEWFTYEHCKDLIDDMYEREQEIPGIVRKLVDDPEGKEYEVVFGGRRHFSADYITSKKGVYKPFKAILKDISDKEAARLMDLENRKRADISDFERCVSYRQQIGKAPGYVPIFNTLNELREAIQSGEDGESSNFNGKSFTKAALSQMTTAGELNEIEELISLFKGRRINIPWSYAYKLMKVWNSGDDSARNKILSRAKVLKDMANSKSPEFLLKELISATAATEVQSALPYKDDLKIGEKVAVKVRATNKDLSFKIPLKILDEHDDKSLLELMKKAMKTFSTQ